MPKASDAFIDSLLDGATKPDKNVDKGQTNDIDAKNSKDSTDNKVDDKKKTEGNGEVVPIDTVDADADDNGSSDPDDSLKSQIKTLELRRKGSETSFNEANIQKLKALKENAILKAQITEFEAAQKKVVSDAEKKFSESFEEKYEADPEGSLKEAIKLLLDRSHSIPAPPAIDMDELLRKQRIVAEEVVIKKDHTDYDEVIEAFLSESQSNETIRTTWNESGQSVAKAYELGKPFFEAKEIIKDPDAYKEKIRAQILAESKTDDKEKTTLSSINSSGPPPKKGDKKHADLASSTAVMGSIGIKGFS